MGKGGKREGVTERARACALLAICSIMRSAGHMFYRAQLLLCILIWPSPTVRSCAGHRDGSCQGQSRQDV